MSFSVIDDRHVRLIEQLFDEYFDRLTKQIDTLY